METFGRLGVAVAAVGLVTWACASDPEGDGPADAQGGAAGERPMVVGGGGLSTGDGGARDTGAAGHREAGAAGAGGEPACITQPLSTRCDTSPCPAHLDDFPSSFCSETEHYSGAFHVGRYHAPCGATVIKVSTVDALVEFLYFDAQGALAAVSTANDVGRSACFGEPPCDGLAYDSSAAEHVCYDDEFGDELWCDDYCEQLTQGGAGGAGGGG